MRLEISKACVIHVFFIGKVYHLTYASHMVDTWFTQG